eukprot:m.246990 g.246990  ORF g.246990 m.246990 type:complete len:51 (+) comp46978_c0_seq1:1090-1242(+)
MHGMAIASSPERAAENHSRFEHPEATATNITNTAKLFIAAILNSQFHLMG